MRTPARAVKASGLAGLAAVKRDLERHREEAAQRARHAAEGVERDRHERELFARTVGPVVPLARERRAQHDRPRPDAVPRQRLRDEAAVLAESISDEFDVESLLDTDAALSFRRDGIGTDVVRKLRRGVWVIQAELDLHGARRDAAREQLQAFLRGAVQSGLRCVRVVHGKGHGSPGRMPVLKSRVRGWLVQSDAVIAFAQARGADGGHGALIVLLRPRTG